MRQHSKGTAQSRDKETHLQEMDKHVINCYGEKLLLFIHATTGKKIRELLSFQQSFEEREHNSS